MPDSPDSSATVVLSAADAAVAVARLEAISDDIRGCAILAADGTALAASGDLDTWSRASADLVRAADAAAGEPVSHAHVGTEDGEAFVVRLGGLTFVAAAERFALAGLMLFDMRSVLRDLARGAPSVADSAASTKAA